MSTEIIIIIAIVAAGIIAGVLSAQYRASKSKQSAPPAPTAPSAPQAATGVATGVITTADYANSFFGGTLDGRVVYAYKLPTGVVGYGPGGAYDKDKYDPKAFDAALERIIGTEGHYVDIRTRTKHYPDGSTEKFEPMTIRQWLYGLSIDPACVPKSDLLGQGIVIAPRGYLRAGTYNGPGSFGGGA